MKLHAISIELKRNQMQIGAKDIENLLVTVMLKFSFGKTYFHSSLHGNQLNRFYLKLSKK